MKLPTFQARRITANAVIIIQEGVAALRQEAGNSWANVGISFHPTKDGCIYLRYCRFFSQFIIASGELKAMMNL